MGETGAATPTAPPAAPPSWRERHHGRIRSLRLGAALILRSPSSLIGAILVAAFLLLALVGPSIVPFPADGSGKVNLDLKLKAPDRTHWFGTDEVGNDVYTRVVLGTRVSLQVGLVVVGIAMLIGVPLGIVAGLSGGWLREAIMRTTDVFLSVPGLVLALAIVAVLGSGIVNAMLALALVWWPGYVRLIESKTLSLKSEPFVDAARALGAGPARIVFRHILPNCVSPIVVKGSMDMGLAILAAASLGFIGLGAQPPYPEWGAMISVGRNYLPEFWWYSAFPGLVIYLTVMGFNLLGDGLRDILDPKSQLAQ